MSKLFIPQSQSVRVSVGLLVVRVVVGVAFVLHGWPKIQDPTGWIEGFGAPSLLVTLAPLAAIGEFVGGILLALGLMAPLATLLIAGTMAGAMMFHLQKGQPFVGTGGSWELPAVFLSIAFLLLCTGPGGFCLDKVLFKKR